MSGYTVTMEAWNALLEDDYVSKKIAGAINTATPFREKLTRKGTTSGRQRVYAVKVGASQGQGARPEGGNTPDYGAGEYVNATVRTKYNYAPFKITGPAESFGSKKAFAEFGVQTLKDTQEGMKLFTGRQCWGDGQGTLCLVNGALLAGVSAATVDSAYGVGWGSLATNTTFLLKRKMVVQFGTEDNSGQGYVITGVSATGFSFSPPLQNNVADDTKISIKGSAGYEIEGALLFAATATFMQAVLGLSTTEYHGIDRALYPEWEGNVVNAGGAALSLALIRAVRDTIFKRTDDETTNLMIGSTEMAADYEALLQPAQRFVSKVAFDGGASGLEHDGLKFSKDSKAPVRMLAFFNSKTIAWAQDQDPNWLKDGPSIMRVVPRQDAKEGLLRWYSNLDPDEPRRQALCYDIGHT